MSYAPTVLGALRYEFRMQIRRKAVWLVLLALSLLLFRMTWGQWARLSASGVTAHDAVLLWTLLFQLFLPIGVGVLVADRLVRDRRTQ
nr:hypothetical protein [Ktedonobacterales bacterium]